MSAGGGERSERGRGGGALDRLIDRGLALYSKGDLDAALGEWRGVLDLDPDNRRAGSYVRYLEQHYESLAARFAAARAVRPEDPDDGSSVLEVEVEASAAGGVRGATYDAADDYDTIELDEPDALELDLGPAGPRATDVGRATPEGARTARFRPAAITVDVDHGWSLEDGWSIDPHEGVTRSGLDPVARVASGPAGIALDELEDRDDEDAATLGPAGGRRAARDSGSDELTAERAAPGAGTNPTAEFDLSESGPADELDLDDRSGRAPSARPRPLTGDGDEELTVDRRLVGWDDRTGEAAAAARLDDALLSFEDETVERPPAYMEGRDAGRSITEADGEDDSRPGAPTGFFRRVSSAADAPPPSEALRAELLAELDDRVPPMDDEDSLRRRLTWLIDRARAESQRGAHGPAIMAIELAHDEQPDSAVAQKVIHRNRDLLFEIYRVCLGDLDAVPTLAIPLEQLAARSLDHRAAFLLSRVDGSLSFEDLLDVAGMPRLEAYRILCRLVLDAVLEIS